MTLELFGLRGADGDTEHLPEKFVADGGYGFGLHQITKPYSVILHQFPACGGNGFPLMFFDEPDGCRYGQEGGEVAGALSLVIVEEPGWRGACTFVSPTDQ